MLKSLSGFCYSNIKVFSYLTSDSLSPLNMPSSPLGAPSPCERPRGVTPRSGAPSPLSLPPRRWPACRTLWFEWLSGASGLKAGEAVLRLWLSYWQVRGPHLPRTPPLPVGVLPPEHFPPDLLSWTSTQGPEAHSSDSLAPRAFDTPGRGRAAATETHSLVCLTPTGRRASPFPSPSQAPHSQVRLLHI